MRPSLVLFEDVLKQWLNVATPPARNIVRKIIMDSPEPLHSHEIFQRSQEHFPLAPQEEEAQRATYAKLLRRTGPSMPPSPIHHIRSLRYLKRVVLPDLEKRNEIAKIHRTRPPSPAEREIAATLKPPTRSQRKRRGAVGPGKRPARLTDSGEIREWVWRMKTPEDNERDAYWAEVERQKKEFAEQQRVQARLIRPTESKLSRSNRMRQWETEQKDYFLPGLSSGNAT